MCMFVGLDLSGPELLYLPMDLKNKLSDSVYRINVYVFNPFPQDKILDQTKLKAFADDKLKTTKMIISVLDRVENIVGKGEIACTSNFSFSHNVFQRLLS